MSSLNKSRVSRGYVPQINIFVSFLKIGVNVILHVSPNFFENHSQRNCKYKKDEDECRFTILIK